ncbi:MAG: hypothetical protein V1799_20440 [bacterium]
MRTWIVSAVILLLVVSTGMIAQFKSSPELNTSVTGSLFRTENNSFLFGLFDPSKLSMRHSFSLSYSSFGGQGLSLGVYTNSMMYQFNDQLDIQADISLMHSPFSSFGKQFEKDLSGIFLSKAQLNYRPSKNMLFQIDFRQLPPMAGYGQYGWPNYYDDYSFIRTREDRH